MENRILRIDLQQILRKDYLEQMKLLCSNRYVDLLACRYRTVPHMLHIMVHEFNAFHIIGSNGELLDNSSSHILSSNLSILFLKPLSSLILVITVTNFLIL